MFKTLDISSYFFIEKGTKYCFIRSLFLCGKLAKNEISICSDCLLIFLVISITLLFLFSLSL